MGRPGLPGRLRGVLPAGSIALFFKSGPFAWNGISGFYLPVVLFVGWVITTAGLMHTDIKRQAEADGTPPPGAEREPAGVR